MKTRVNTILPYMLTEVYDARFDTQSGPAVMTVETISRPYPEGDDEVIQVRLVPGDPNTVKVIPTTELNQVKLRTRPRKGIWVHYAEVSGFGSFPSDMLRYDSCQLHPDSDDCFDYDEAFAEYRVKRNLPAKKRIIVCQVSTQAKPRWTPARWASFTWKINHLKTFKLSD